VTVFVEDGEAPGRERVGVSVGLSDAAGALERVADIEAVGIRERVGVPVAEIEAARRERVGVSVAEIEAATRETDIVGTRDLVAVSVTEPDTATACERDAVALILPPPTGVCAHPAEAASAKKKSFLIIFIPVLYLLSVISSY